MGLITDKAMQATVGKTDQWQTEDGPRGSGRFLGRITRSGERAFYFRHTVAAGQRDTLLIGPYDPKGREGMTVAPAGTGTRVNSPGGRLGTALPVRSSPAQEPLRATGRRQEAGCGRCPHGGRARAAGGR